MKKIKWISNKTIFIITILSGIFGFIVDISNAMEKMKIFVISIYDKIPELLHPYIIWFLFSVIMYFILIGARNIYYKIIRKIRRDYISKNKEFADSDTEFIKKMIVPKLYKNDSELYQDLFIEKDDKLTLKLSEATLDKFFDEKDIEKIKTTLYTHKGLSILCKEVSTLFKKIVNSKKANEHNRDKQ